MKGFAGDRTKDDSNQITPRKQAPKKSDFHAKGAPTLICVDSKKRAPEKKRPDSAGRHRSEEDVHDELDLHERVDAVLVPGPWEGRHPLQPFGTR